MRRGRFIIAAVAAALVASGCRTLLYGPPLSSDPGELLLFVLIAPALWLVQELAGEAIGAALRAFLPDWMKTRRALFTGIAILAAAVIGAVVWMNLAPPR